MPPFGRDGAADYIAVKNITLPISAAFDHPLLIDGWWDVESPMKPRSGDGRTAMPGLPIRMGRRRSRDRSWRHAMAYRMTDRVRRMPGEPQPFREVVSVRLSIHWKNIMEPLDRDIGRDRQKTPQNNRGLLFAPEDNRAPRDMANTLTHITD